jgi:L-ascorbate metabolism protein UlaG (beta-lactamase superfamily)
MISLLRLLGFVAGLSAVCLLGGCETTFARITWLNVGIVLRTPDTIAGKVTHSARPDARLSVLWVGHATALIQIDDKFILTDPVFTRFVGGVSPRLVEPGIAPENLPPLAAVLVSHRHFDHLSSGSFPMIASKLAIVLTAPGAGEDIPAGNYVVRELRSWQQWEQHGLRVTAVPVIHTGGRWIADAQSHPEAFAGFVVEYHGLTVFFPGDTAFGEQVFRDIAARFPSIDLALMPIGPIKPQAAMLPGHMNPVEALAATRLLGAAHMVPIHFGTFINSLDGPGEVEAAFAAAVAAEAAPRTSTGLLRIGEQRILQYKHR